MAQNLDITIKIKQVGQEAIDRINEQLKNLKKTLAETNFAPILEVTNSLQKIGQSVQGIEKLSQNVVKNVSKQAIDAADSTATRMNDNINRSLETLFARFGLLVGGAVAISTEAGATFVGTLLSGGIQLKPFVTFIETALTDVFNTGGVFLTSALGQLVTVKQIATDLVTISTGITGSLFGILKLMGGMAGVAFGVMLPMRIFFGESLQFAKRIIGHGQESLTPLERISRLTTTLDTSVHKIGLTTGQLMKTVVFGVATVIGPFSGLIAGIPFVNSTITTLVRLGETARLRIFSFFGSARAQVSLIFMEVKKFAESFISVRRNANGAAGDFKKLIFPSKLTTEAQELSRTRLPFAVQFQGFAIQARGLLTTLLTQVSELAGIITVSAGLSTETLTKIKADAKTATTTLNKGLQDSVLNLEKVAQYTVGQKLFAGMINSLKFAGNSFMTVFSLPLTLLQKIDQKATSFALSIAGLFGSVVKGTVVGLFNFASGALGKVGNFIGGIMGGGKNKVPEPQKKTQDQTVINKVMADGTVIVQKYEAELTFLADRFQTFAKTNKEAKEKSSVLSTELDNLRKRVGELVKAMQDIANGKDVKNFANIWGRTINTMAALVGKSDIFASLQKELKGTDISKLFPVSEIKKILTEISTIGGTTFGSNLLKTIKGKMTEEAFKVLDVAKFLIPTGAQAKTAGENIVKQIGAGEEAALPSIARKTDTVLQEGIANKLPQSPAKSGPLRNLVKMGSTVVAQIAQGMTGAVGIAGKAASTVAERIAGYFPRSPALFGALVFLPKMGIKIVSYLVEGILAGMSHLSSALNGVSVQISQSLERAFKVEEMAVKSGIAIQKIGMLQNAMIEVGGNADDLSYTFNKINDTLRQAFSNEDLLKFQRLGIDLDAVRASGDPALALLFKVADVVKTFGINSRQADDALNLIGVTAGSNIIPLLAKGSGEIQKLMQQGADLGIVYDKAFIKSGAQLKAMIARVELIKNTLIDTFLGSILPTIVNFGDEILSLFSENQATIMAFLKTVGQGVSEVLKSIRVLFSIAMQNSGDTWTVIKNVLASLLGFVIDFVGVLFEAVAGKAKAYYRDFGAFALYFWKNYLNFFFAEIRNYVNSAVEKVLVGIFENVYSFAKKYPKLSAGALVLFPSLSKLFAESKNITEAYKEEIKSASNATELFQKAVIQTEKDVEDLKKNWKLPEVTAATTFAGVKDTVKQLLTDLQQSFTGTAFEGEIAGLSERLSKLFTTPFEDAKAAAKAAQTEITATLTNIKKVQETNQLDLASSVRQTAEQYKLSREAELKNIGLRQDLLIRTAETESEAKERQRDKDFTDLESKQNQEYEEFKNTLYEKMSAQERAEKINEFLGLQDLERVRLLEKQKREAFLGTLDFFTTSAQGVATMFEDLYALSKENVKEFFYAAKAAAIVEATMNIAQGITKALAQGGVFGIAQAAMVGAFGTVQIAKIIASTLGFAHGGPVGGGSGVRDDVPALLTAGEYVQPRGVVNYYGAKIMEAMRQRVIPREALANLAGNFPSPIYRPSVPRFAEGGVVSPTQAQQAPANNISIVNVVDPSMLDQYLASSVGTRKLVNLIGNNQPDFRRALGIG